MATSATQLLTAAPVGALLQIEIVMSAHAGHSLKLLGIAAEESVLLEERDEDGELMVCIDARRIQVPEHLARKIRVRQVEAVANDPGSRAA